MKKKAVVTLVTVLLFSSSAAVGAYYLNENQPKNIATQGKVEEAVATPVEKPKDSTQQTVVPAPVEEKKATPKPVVKPAPSPVVPVVSSNSVYKNNDYHYELAIPASWGKYTVKTTTETASANELARTEFTFKVGPENIVVFSVVILHNTPENSAYVKDGLLTFVGQNDKYIYSMIHRGDPTELLLQKGHEADLKKMQNMIMVDYPQIKKSFHIQ